MPDPAAPSPGPAAAARAARPLAPCPLPAGFTAVPKTAPLPVIAQRFAGLIAPAMHGIVPCHGVVAPGPAFAGWAVRDHS